MRNIVSEVIKELFEGGPGSGHWGHKGRPGMRGGSAPGGGSGVRFGKKDALNFFRNVPGGRETKMSDIELIRAPSVGPAWYHKKLEQILPMFPSEKTGVYSISKTVSRKVKSEKKPEEVKMPKGGKKALEFFRSLPGGQYIKPHDIKVIKDPATGKNVWYSHLQGAIYPPE
ncbi:MAG: hypothetical protein QXY90_07055 [Candidatus Anstonellales archaeon]